MWWAWSRRKKISKLGRWYLRTGETRWVRNIRSSTLGPFTDHRAVALRFANPEASVQVKKGHRVYPVPALAVTAVNAIANIHCLKKNTRAAVPLDHRRVAVLNTDYKVFTRVFATSLRSHRSAVFHPLQAGFVPRWNIATPINTFLAIQRQAKVDSDMIYAYALLLDLPKPMTRSAGVSWWPCSALRLPGDFL